MSSVKKLLNGIIIKNGLYLTTGGLYQSTLSNEQYLSIKNIIKNTGLEYTSISTKLKNTCCFSSKAEIEELTKVKNAIIKNQKDKMQKIKHINSDDIKNVTCLSPEKLPIIKSIPEVICPLGLYIIENYPPIVQKKENCIIVLQVGENDKNENIFAAITIYNDSLYNYDRKGEFIGNETQLIEYIKNIKNSIILNSIHSTMECHRLIEDTFFNENFVVKKIGVNPKNTKEFKYSSEDIFWSKRALSNASKLNFFDFNLKEKKFKKFLIFFGSGFLVSSILGYGAYAYYQSYQEEQERIRQAELAKLQKPPVVYSQFNSIQYFNNYCFKELNNYVTTSPNWALRGLVCNNKEVKYLFQEQNDLGNIVANKNDFIQSYNIESKNYSKFKFENKQVTYKSSIKFQGIDQTKIIKFSEAEIRKYIAQLTAIQNDAGYNIKINNNQGKMTFNVISDYSPMYLQENYGLFNKLYIEEISLNIDNDGVYHWQIKGKI